MQRLLHAKPPLLSSSSQLSQRFQQTSNSVVDVFVFGDSEILFLVSSDKSGTGSRDQVFFPDKVSRGHDGGSAAHKDRGGTLLCELQRVAAVEVKKEQRAAKKCLICSLCGGYCGIAAASTVRVEGLHVVVFFVLECDCLVFASFTLNTATPGPGLEVRSLGKASLLAARWFRNGAGGLACSADAFRQNYVPISSVIDCCDDAAVTGAAATAASVPTFPPPSSSSTLQRQNRPLSMGPHSNSYRGHLAVLRIAFVRVVGWVEYVELVWWEKGTADDRDGSSQQWRELRGFSQVAAGALFMQVAGWTNDSFAAVREARAVHWLPCSYDYEQQYPLLAVLHQHMHVKGDALVDRLSIFALSMRRQSVDQSESDLRGQCSWNGWREKVSGFCMNGPWRLEALTLAHPCFLLHVSDAATSHAPPTRFLSYSKACAGDVLGVFLRPAHVMYPRSSFLREDSAYATWEPVAVRAMEVCEKGGGFDFVLYGECGEVARCPVGGFIESAVSCAVEPFEERRVSGAASGVQRIVAAVAAIRSGGALLFLEVISNASPLGNKGKRPSGDVPVVFSILARVVTLCEPRGCNPFQHLSQLVAVRWDGGKGSVVTSVVCDEPDDKTVEGTYSRDVRHMYCSLTHGELLAKDKGALQLKYGETGQRVSGKQQCNSGCLWPRVGIRPTLQFSSDTDIYYSVGAQRSVDFDVLSHCILPPAKTATCGYVLDDGEEHVGGEEIAVFRSGDICLCRHFSSEPASELFPAVSRSEKNYKWLSKVHWPSADELDMSAALTLLFSSATVDVCMAAMRNRKRVGGGGVDVKAEGNTFDSLDEINLLFVCWSTAIIVTAGGKVLWVGDLRASPSETIGAFPSLFACMLRPFAIYDSSFFFLLSASTTPYVHGDVGSAGVNSVFLLLQVPWLLSESGEGTEHVIAVCVTDVCFLTTDGHPLFAFMPSVCPQQHVTLNHLEKQVAGHTLCRGEMMYCSSGALRAVTSALLFVTSATGLDLVARFLPSCEDRVDHASRDNTKVVLDLRNVIADECHVDVTPLFTETTLIQCVRLPAGDCQLYAIVISFLSGLTLVAVSHSFHCGWWDLQLVAIPPVASTGVSEVGNKNVPIVAPFVRLQRAPATVVADRGILFCAQDACGGKWAFCFRLTDGASQECGKQREVGGESLFARLNFLHNQTQRSLGESHTSGETGERVVVTRSAGGPFTFFLIE
ncbi:uncharacterized protein TEOVI_000555500 [Trypanosoma equiperdum]|uniref:Uncharacterized protein n=1 Tax=Trypanosoma equiperdum TaxID=5694 RepID=A0A1G4I7D6_TRYEQ|nr:hypothetical protein, conserved [Trypanosoma equiperdum]